MKNLLPYIALFIVSIIYGASYVVAKGVMPNIIGPSGFILLRAAGAASLFWIFYLFSWELPAKKDLGRMAICGLFGVAVNQLFFFNGLNLTSAMNSSIIITTNPIMVLLIAAVFLGEKITERKALGVILGFIGAIILIWLGAQNKSGGTSVHGDLFILVNAMSYAIYLVTVKPLMVKYRPLTVIAWVFLFGMIYVIPFGYSQFAAVDWSLLNGVQFRSLPFVVLFATFGVYLLNVFALKSVSPSVVSTFIYLQPVMAALFSWLFFSLGTYSNVTPHFSWGMLGATLMIFTGVWLVSKKRITTSSAVARTP